jgi:hypothetical protein
MPRPTPAKAPVRPRSVSTRATARPEPARSSDDLVVAYKRILSRVLETRPSGTRQRLADALGKHRSFITQMTSPAYATPIPQRHLTTLFAVCHFSPAERDAFLSAWRAAHPGRSEPGAAGRRTRHLSLLVPELGDARSNSAFDKAISEFVQRLAGLMHQGGDE